ncbi:MAG: dephospho-CoA kinase [Bacillota bacterium]|jgi:dephospho-CoA kinase
MSKWQGLYVIGLTGGIASGKSTVSSMLSELGAVIIDADRLTREVQSPSSGALEEIRTAFGDEVILPDGSLDRRKLAEVVFRDRDALELLGSIIHPRVIARTEELLREMQSAALEEGRVRIVVVDAPLLLEAGVDRITDEVWVVALCRDEQVRRLMKREGYTRDEALSRIDSQMPLEEKKKRADHIIDNSGSVQETKEQVFTLWQSLERRSSAGSRNSPA